MICESSTGVRAFRITGASQFLRGTLKRPHTLPLRGPEPGRRDRPWIGAVPDYYPGSGAGSMCVPLPFQSPW